MASRTLKASRGGTLLRLALAASVTALTGCGGVSKWGGGPPVPSATPDQTAALEEIFNKYAKAVGVQGAADRIESYALKGTFEMMGKSVKLPVEIYVKKPDKSLMIIEVPGFGVIRRGMSGGAGWSQTFFNGVTEFAPNELTEVERDHDVYRPAQIRGLYQSVSMEGRARLNGRDVYVVEGKPAEGPSEKMLFDVETGLLLRWDVVWRAPGRPKVFARIYLDDYREVGGVKVPFTIRYFFDPREMVLRFEEVKYNIPLDDAMFKKPQDGT